MPDLKGYAAAQAAWERQEPDYWKDEGWCECDACKGKGYLPNPADESDSLPCELCEGEGGWDEDGVPCSEHDYECRKDREEEAYYASRYEDRN